MFNIFGSPKKFTGHFLDPMKGYYTSEIEPDSKADAEKLAKIADGSNLYFLIHYENGEKVQTMVPASKKSAWMKLKESNY